MSGLQVKQVYKQYEQKPLLAGVDLDVHTGEIVALLGSSGSGKSTLLRIIAGLEQADAGQVFWNEQELTRVAVHNRKFGFMFQDYALFPHLTVADNIAFGLRLTREKKDMVANRINELLEQFNLVDYGFRAVQELSGGEQQRVSLARTLANRPRLLLLDEPLAALDRSLRSQLLAEIRDVLKRTGTPAIYVTHDQDEAFAVADCVALLSAGKIIQNGSPDEIFHHPVNEAVATFFGLTNQLKGTVLQAGKLLLVETNIGRFNVLNIGNLSGEVKEGAHVILLLREAQFGAQSMDLENHIIGIVEESHFSVAGYHTKISVNNLVMNFLLEKPNQPGETIRLYIQPEDITLLLEEAA